MKILKKLKSFELDKDKIKNFKNVVIVQLVLITIAMLFRDTSDLIGLHHIEKYMKPFSFWY